MTAVPGVTGLLQAKGTRIDSGSAGAEQKTVSEGSSGPAANDEKAVKAAEAQKEEEAKKTEEEVRKAAQEAKKIIVARVNGADISMFMLVRAMNRISPKYAEKGKAASSDMTEKIKKEALERLIFEELAVQAAVKAGINPAPEAIEKVVSQIKENLESEQAYREYLDANDLTEDALKGLIVRSQRYELITAREVYGKVKVDEKLIRDEYEKEKSRFVLPENLLVDDVFFLQSREEAVTKRKADEILGKIRKNNNDPWKLVLDGTFIVRKLKIAKEKHLEIHKAITDMKVGDLSGVINDMDGLHIIKVVTKEPARQLTLDEARSRLELKFLVPAQDQRRDEWEKELRKDAHIEILP
jgi:parvulin-like peptidyl-prolyl isomerase